MSNYLERLRNIFLAIMVFLLLLLLWSGQHMKSSYEHTIDMLHVQHHTDEITIRSQWADIDTMGVVIRLLQDSLTHCGAYMSGVFSLSPDGQIIPIPTEKFRFNFAPDTTKQYY